MGLPLLCLCLAEKLDLRQGRKMLLQETAEFRLICLDGVSLVTDPASIVIADAQERRYERGNYETEEWAEEYHRGQAGSGRDDCPEDRRQEVGAEIRDFVDWATEGVQHLPHRSPVVVFRRERTEVSQEGHPQVERGTLRSSKRKVTAKRVEYRPSFMTHEDEADRYNEKAGIASWEDGIDQPSHAKRSDKDHKAGQGEAKEAGEVQGKMRSDFLIEPAKF